LVLRLSEGLGIRVRCLTRRVILHTHDSAFLAALRQVQSRGISRLRRSLRVLRGALQWEPQLCLFGPGRLSGFVRPKVCVSPFLVSLRGHSLCDLRPCSSLGNYCHHVQFASLCRGTFLVWASLAVGDSCQAAADGCRCRRSAQRLCRLVAVPFTPTGALPAGPPTLRFSDA
jgi:hypothetical protein